MAGANIHAPCVNRSLWVTNIVEKDIHIGYVHLYGMEQKAAHCIVQQRAMNGHFRSTWLDEEGHFFDTTHFPNFLKMSPFRGKGIYKITGKVVEEYGFPSIEVVKMERLAFCVDERYRE